MYHWYFVWWRPRPNERHLNLCQWRGNSDFWKAKRCLSSWKYSVRSSSWTQLCWQTGRKLRKKAGLALTHHPMDYLLKGFPWPKKIGEETGGRDQEYHMRKSSLGWSLSIIHSPTQVKYSRTCGWCPSQIFLTMEPDYSAIFFTEKHEELDTWGEW